MFSPRLEQDHDLEGDDVHGSCRQKLTRGQLVRISSGMLGLMFGWAVKVSHNDPKDGCDLARSQSAWS